MIKSEGHSEGSINDLQVFDEYQFQNDNELGGLENELEGNLNQSNELGGLEVNSNNSVNEID